MVAARPDIDKRVEQLVSKGRWSVPGYTVSLTVVRKSCANADDLAGEIRQPLGDIGAASTAIIP